jgi:hypothetical protein
VLRPTQVSFGRFEVFKYGAVTLYGAPYPDASSNLNFVTPMRKTLQPREGKPPRFGLFRFRSPLLTESIFLSVPPGT